jgi:hypothetical protein
LKALDAMAVEDAFVMKDRKRRKNLSLPGMMTELMLASCETIARRTLLDGAKHVFPGRVPADGNREGRGGRRIWITIHLQRGQGIDGFGNGALAPPRSLKR